jgi:predicted secreted Zn-dependent protease
MNDNLLNHERGHFYITVIYAKMMDDALKAFEVGADEFTKNSLQNNVQDIFNAFYAEMDAAQKRYDRETNHGLDEEIQYKWDLWFKEKMALIDSVNQR